MAKSFAKVPRESPAQRLHTFRHSGCSPWKCYSGNIVEGCRALSSCSAFECSSFQVGVVEGADGSLLFPSRGAFKPSRSRPKLLSARALSLSFSLSLFLSHSLSPARLCVFCATISGGRERQRVAAVARWKNEAWRRVVACVRRKKERERESGRERESEVTAGDMKTLSSKPQNTQQCAEACTL